MIAHPDSRTAQHVVDRAEIVALVESVLAWDLSSRDRKGPSPRTVEFALTHLFRYAKALRDGLASCIEALSPGDDIRLRAAVTLSEADRRLQATEQAQGNALRAQQLARLVRSLHTVSGDAEDRLRPLAATGPWCDVPPTSGGDWL